MAAHLVFLPWALGTMHVWSQCISFGFSVLSFGLALVPRTYTDGFAGTKSFRVIMWPKLVRFPVFWIGLGLMLYILVQALNPAWIYCTDGRVWWLQGLNPIRWLPSGMATPFDQASPWRSLMICATAWMTTCAIWTGFTRRRSLHRLLLTLALNGVVLSVVGIVQKLTGATDILWHFPAPVTYFFATIIYKNHATGYLNLTLAVALGLVLWYRERADRRMEPSDPSLVMLLAVLTIFTADLFTTSRLGMALGGVGLGLGILVYGLLILRQGRTTGNFLPCMLTVVIVVAFAAVGFSLVNWGSLSGAYQRLLKNDQNVSVIARIHARDATWQMFSDNPVTGYGAGAFRFYFPVYQKQYPDICQQQVWTGREIVIRPAFWEFAHNDYVQCLAELGLIGTAFVAAIVGFWLVRFGRQKRWMHPIGFGAVIAMALTAVQCWADFELHNPAILITLGAILTAASGWVVIEKERTHT